MNILHIDCSPRPGSQSRQLSAEIVEKLLEGSKHATIKRRDIGLDPLPHTGADYASAMSSPVAAAAAPDTAWKLSEEVILEVEAADAIVIGTPMNNFTLPSNLKAWIDQLLRVGRSIMATPTGKLGMLRDRPVFIGIASGGVFAGENAKQPDFLTPYVSAAFGCVGITSLQFFAIQATAFLEPAQFAPARAEALSTIDLTAIGKIR